MMGTIGYIFLTASFVASIAAVAAYSWAAYKDNSKVERIAGWLWGAKGITLLISSGVLIYLIMTHQFQYYYVWNYTSLDLEPQYLFSAFYGGQEGSFMLWIICGFVVGLGLIRWTRPPYKAPVMAVMAVTQVFLLSMVVGWDVFGAKIGASPFRTIAQEMPNAPFIQANPDFVPSDGSGLNDLLKSPWMMIHPPIIFVGFAMMTVPFAFAIASLWTKTYHEWIRPALPWTLAANLCLLTAIFLGGYWAYETLSFGGYWAWDPVENASLVPWLIGTAGIHAMIIQRKSSRAHKASLFLSILAYIAIVYQTFLTRSGVLGSQSVHSFVDLGLYNQLLMFILVMTLMGIGFYLYRYKELPSPQKESTILSREFMTFTGSMLLLILGLVIIFGTSSPLIGRFIVDNPTPPEIDFYNEWSMPIAIVMAIFTVLGQNLFWRKYDWESLAGAMIVPLLLTSVASILSIVLGEVRNIYYMIFIFAGWFAVFGNGIILFDLLRRKPKLIGGAMNHIGFGVLLLGIIASSVYTEPLLDKRAADYNERIEEGTVFDEEGFPVTQPVEMFQLELDRPKLVNDRWMVTYEGYEVSDSPRPGQQSYRVKFEPVNGGNSFYMDPVVYPMLTTSSSENVEWSVDPHVKTGVFEDIYFYVAGSKYVENENERVAAPDPIMPVSGNTNQDEDSAQSVEIERGGKADAGDFSFSFIDFRPADEDELPENTQIGIRALMRIEHTPSGRAYEVEPLFAVYTEDEQSYTYSPPLEVESWEMELQFTRLLPESESIEIRVDGPLDDFEEDWVLVVAETKPFVSVVWLGTFLLMGGFSISILRHWSREKKKQKDFEEET
ncbi:MAG: cytochrome c biogenesis protein CcsA [Balneolaceae bacterium]